MQVTIIKQPLYGTVIWNGTDFVYTPNTGFVGRDSYVYTVVDGGVSQTLTNYTNTENRAPSATNISLTGNANEEMIIDVMSYVSDPDSLIYPLKISHLSPASFGYISITGDTTIKYQSRGYNSNEFFTYTITDGQYSSTGSISIETVNGIDQVLPYYLMNYAILEADMRAIIANSANWSATYNILCANSANWSEIDSDRYNRTSTVVETLSSDLLDIVNSKSLYDSSYSIVSSNSATWNNNALQILEIESVLSANSANWNNSFNTLCANSAIWDQTDIDLADLKAEYNSISSLWESVYNTVNSNSAVNWNHDSIVSTIQYSSGSWQDSYTAVSTNSGIWDQSVSDLNSLTTDYQSSSATWNSMFNLVSSSSGSWGDTSSVATLSTNSGHWEDSYTIVRDNSATWNTLQANDQKYDDAYSVLSGNSATWMDTYTVVNTNSSTWDSSNSMVASQSAKWLHGGNDVDITTNDLYVYGNAVFYGSLTADGGRTEINSTVTATSSFSITNTGFVDALQVTKTQTTGAIAKFSSSNSTVLYIDPTNKVGVNTQTPNVALTVHGDISATGTIYGRFPDGYTTFQNNSAKYEASYSYLNPVTGSINGLIAAKPSYDNSVTFVSGASATVNTMVLSAASYDSAYATVASQSANNSASYSFLTANSGSIGTDTLYRSKSANYDTAYSYYTNNSSVNCQINFIFDGDGAIVKTGSFGTVQIPTGVKILSWTLLADTPTTTYVEILSSNYSSYPVFVNMSGTNPANSDYPQLTGGVKATRSTLTHWMTSISSDTILQFTLPQNTAATSVTMSLKCVKV